MLRRVSSVVGARLRVALEVARAATSRVIATGGLTMPSTSSVAEKKLMSSGLPKARPEIFAGSCEVYNESKRSIATKMSVPLGFGAGVFGSLVGVGGGVLIVPTMTATVPIPQRVITGTSLIAVLSTASVSSINFWNGDSIDFAAAAVVGSAAMLFAPLGATATTKVSNVNLKRILAYFLLFAAPLVPIKAYAFASKKNSDDSKNIKKLSLDAIKENPVSALSLSLIGACAGFASGLVGIGGGTIVTPLLALTSDLNQATVLGTSLLAMLLPSAAALNQHRKMGNVDWRIGTALGVGCAVGGFFGSQLAIDAPSGALELAFFLGMLFLSYRTFRGLPKGGVKMKG